MGVFSRVLFDSFRRTPIGVAFTQHRVHGGALDLVVPGFGALLGLVLRSLGVVGQREAVGLQLGDGLLELWHRRADVRQLDDVRLGRERERAELGERVGRALRRGQQLGEGREDSTGERDVPGLHVDFRVLRERLHDRQE